MTKKMIKEERAARRRPVQRARPGQQAAQHRRAPIVRFGAGALALVVLLGIFLYYGRGTTPDSTAVAASASLGPLTAGRPAGSTGNYQHVSAPLLQGRKPVLLFIGAQYCPFCAAERWSIVKALALFGTWPTLAVGHSTAGQSGFGDVPTFDLLHATYRSPHAVFEGKDVADGSGAALQSLTPDEQSLLNRYDPTGSIPMIYVDGYVLLGSDYSPAELQGRTFAEVQGQLQQNSGATYVRDINAEANLLTAFLCKADGNEPHAACGSSVIQEIEQELR